HVQVICEREFSPLRWLVRRERDGYQLQLINDTGSVCAVTMYRFESPDVEVILDFDSFDTPRAVPHEGGLYLAGTRDSGGPVVVSPFATKLHELREIRVHPRIGNVARRSPDLNRLIALQA